MSNIPKYVKKEAKKQKINLTKIKNSKRVYKKNKDLKKEIIKNKFGGLWEVFTGKNKIHKSPKRKPGPYEILYNRRWMDEYEDKQRKKKEKERKLDYEEKIKNVKWYINTYKKSPNSLVDNTYFMPTVTEERAKERAKEIFDALNKDKILKNKLKKEIIKERLEEEIKQKKVFDKETEFQRRLEEKDRTSSRNRINKHKKFEDKFPLRKIEKRKSYPLRLYK